jgi:hypothetical protein
MFLIEAMRMSLELQVLRCRQNIQPAEKERPPCDQEEIQAALSENHEARLIGLLCRIIRGKKV